REEARPRRPRAPGPPAARPGEALPRASACPPRRRDVRRLWPHQLRALEVCRELHQGDRSRVLLQFPPGTGKTECAVLIALAWLALRPFGRVIIVVPTEPILLQFFRRLALATTIPIAVEKAERHAPAGARLVVASQNSLWSRLHKYAEDTLLIV